MNKIILIGNLTRDPETRTTSTGLNVCSFTIAVNRRRSANATNQPEADFFRITTWKTLAENCQKYLAKGRKVGVTGSVSVSTYEGKDGATRSSLDVTAEDIEFLSPKEDGEYHAPMGTMENKPKSGAEQGGFTQVEEDELPF
jgi:single-strand DNA-binding protein